MSPKKLSLFLFLVAIFLRIIFFCHSDLWVDEVGTLHHSLQWNLDQIQEYFVNSGYYALLQLLSGKNETALIIWAEVLNLLGCWAAWFALGKRAKELGEDPFWPQLLILFWPLFFVFNSVMRSYSFSAGLLFLILWLLDTEKIKQNARIFFLFFCCTLAAYTQYSYNFFLIPLLLFSNQKNFRYNVFVIVSIPIVFWPATQYVIDQVVFKAPQNIYIKTGTPNNYLDLVWDPTLMFNWPRSIANVLSSVLTLLFVLGRWRHIDLLRWISCLVIYTLVFWMFKLSFFPRYSLPLLMFIIPGVVVGARKALGKWGPAVVFMVIVLCLPHSLSRSIKVNGSREAERIIREHGNENDRIAVYEGSQGVPLYYLLNDSFAHIVIFYQEHTLPEFNGVDRESISYSHREYMLQATAGTRLWLWDDFSQRALELKEWPVVSQWPVDSGGNGSRVLQLREKSR